MCDLCDMPLGVMLAGILGIVLDGQFDEGEGEKVELREIRIECGIEGTLTNIKKKKMKAQSEQ